LDNPELVDPAYVQAADLAFQPRRRSRTLAAAAIALAVLGGAGLFLAQQDRTAELPLLTLPLDGSGGMGFEGYLAHDCSELINANPWTEAKSPDKLPVFRNLGLDGPDLELMEALLLRAAEGLGLDTDELTVLDNVPDLETQAIIREKVESVGDTLPEGYFDPTALRIETPDFELEIDQSLTLRVKLTEPRTLPPEYNFNDNGGATPAELEEAAAYLLEQYGDFLGFEEPSIDINGGDYTINGQQLYTLSIYEGAGNKEQQLLGYNFKRADFYANDEGQLYMLRLYQSQLTESLGDYPLISRAEAEELLSQGHFVSNVPADFPGVDFVRKAELLYRHGRSDEIFVPYYRFLVELPEMETEDYKTYGAYYVPAVEPRYLTNLPLWDGHFN